MPFLLSTRVLVTLLAVSSSYALEFSYSDQGSWPGICVNGNEMRQSPINIITADVRIDQSLPDLQFSSGWGENTDGVFLNTGHNVQFDLDSPGSASTRNHLGNYLLQQAHMHWGEEDGKGSEHRIDGSQHELEIHFVHLKEGATDSTQSDYISVVAVFAEVDDDASITGPWAQLNVSAIQPYGANISVTDFVLNQLLPDNRDYFYYEGSLTTPSCSETVAWFVLKNTIRVPGSYLNQLRQVEEDAQSTLLEFNYRMAQSLAGRTVMTTGSQAGIKPYFSVVLSCVVLIVGLFY